MRCMARSLCSLRQVATLRHGHMARRFAPAFRALDVNIADYVIVISSMLCSTQIQQI